jgi:DUF438 domain-containing protein
MKDSDFIHCIIDQFKYPIVFVDTTHTIRYVNRVANEKNKAKGRGELLNTSIFECHNSASNEKIRDYYEQFKKGANEFFLTINKRNQKVFMVAVRDENNELIGYYERYEDIHAPDAVGQAG